MCVSYLLLPSCSFGDKRAALHAWFLRVSTSYPLVNRTEYEGGLRESSLWRITPLLLEFFPTREEDETEKQQITMKDSFRNIYCGVCSSRQDAKLGGRETGNQRAGFSCSLLCRAFMWRCREEEADCYLQNGQEDSYKDSNTYSTSLTVKVLQNRKPTINASVQA